MKINAYEKVIWHKENTFCDMTTKEKQFNRKEPLAWYVRYMHKDRIVMYCISENVEELEIWEKIKF